MRTPAALAPSSRRVALALVLLASALPATARATSSDCVRVPDGSPCRTDCRVDGTCRGGNCLGGIPEPDGTACATGLICTLGDSCKSGVCQAGAPVVCGPDPCGPAQCVEGVGCLPIVPCDMARPVDLASFPDLRPPPDLAPLPGDGSSGPFDANVDEPKPDLSLPADLALPAPDMTVPPTDGGGGEVDGGAPDLPVVIDGDVPPDAEPPDLEPPDLAGLDLAGLDLTGEPDLVAEPPDAGAEDDGGLVIGLHVHGSGCALDGRAPGSASVLLLLAGVAGLLAGRRRRRGDV